VHIIVIHQTTSRADVFIKIHILSVMKKSPRWRLTSERKKKKKKGF
jgi:hypothetical protein